MIQKKNIEKSNKIKIYIGIVYLLVVFLFLYILFSNFSFEEITSYEFIKIIRDYLILLKENNIILASLIFIISSIIWVMLLGFGSPPLLIAGFIFGNWYGAFIGALGLTVGATMLYIFGNYFFSELIKNLFKRRFTKYSKKFKNNEFLIFTFYRFVGGIPFAIANLIPVLFNIKIKNYFFGTFFGILPSLFIIASLGHGLEKTVQQNDQSISFIELILLPEIYTPILCFFLLMIISILARKMFYKN